MKDRCVKKCGKVLNDENTFRGNLLVCKTCSNKRSIFLFKIGEKFIKNERKKKK